MVKVWYRDDLNTDPRLEHHLNPPEFLTLEELYKKTGFEHFAINMDTYKTDGILEKIRKNRGYSYEDEMTLSKECLPDYDAKLKEFFQEHLHAHEEVRLVTDGSGYFDVRDANEKWIRIAISAGDMIVIPPGIYHRFTLDTNNYIQAKLYFVDKSGRLPQYRPADNMECRKEYLKRLEKNFVN